LRTTPLRAAASQLGSYGESSSLAGERRAEQERAEREAEAERRIAELRAAREGLSGSMT
jgi:hypothetical protein